MAKKAIKNTDISKPLVRLLGLINVLSPGQKRAFKRDAHFWSDKQESTFYVHLFDEVCKYASKPAAKKNLLEVLMRKSEKRPPKEGASSPARALTIQDVSVRANYLYHRILETMRFVKTRSATFKELNGAMQDIYFLYNNDLPEDCLKLITETISLAKKIDRPSYILELCALERRILFAKNTNDISTDRFESIIQMEDQARAHLFFYNHITVINNKLMTYKINKLTLPDEIRAEIEKVIDEYGDDKQVKDLGIRNRFQLFILFSEYYIQIFDTSGNADFEQSSNEYRARLYDLLKNEPTFREDEYPLYQLSVSVYLINLLRQNKNKEVEAELAELEKDQDRLFQCKTLAYIKIQMYTESGRYEAAFNYIREINLASNLRLYNSQIWPSRMIILCFLGAHVSLMMDAFPETHKWVKMIVQDSRYEVMPNLRLPMPFIQALVQFETAPSKSEEELVNTLQKDLKKLTKIYTNENLKPLVHFSNQLKPVFIEFIKEKKMRSRLTAVVKEQLLEKANQLKAETLPNTPFEPFRIPVAWMLSHLKNSKISEEMKS